MGEGYIQERIQKINELKSILKERYQKCNSQGHRKLQSEDNYCTYCYRPLEWETPETEAFSEMEPTRMVHQSLTEVIHQKRQEEIQAQEDREWFRGLYFLEKELYSFPK